MADLSPAGGTPGDDALRRLDDPDFPALTMSQAAALLGVQAAFLRSLDASGVLQPHRSPGGHRRYSRHQLSLAARLRGLLDDGHTLASAEVILGLQDELADARADSQRLQRTVDRLRARDDDAADPEA
jgi:DNA-binding transcriptional MerR regulator